MLSWQLVRIEMITVSLDPQGMEKDFQVMVEDPQEIMNDLQVIVKDLQVIMKAPQTVVNDPSVKYGGCRHHYLPYSVIK